ncbi:MAG TPA: hypothetical protein VFO89_14890 [Thermoanaerobaculia bacterium]|nr:hypothetical protein [Thermoanaerobaculia bacterium]
MAGDTSATPWLFRGGDDDEVKLSLRVKLTRLSNTHHRFEYVRGDGTGEAAELETRSLLYHDLLHFAVETEAGLTRSFYGLLARSVTFAQLRADPNGAINQELAMTERAVGILTGLLRSEEPAAELVPRVASYLHDCGLEAPEWISPQLVTQVAERMRRLLGEWNALRFGQTMELRFEIGAAPR